MSSRADTNRRLRILLTAFARHLGAPARAVDEFIESFADPAVRHNSEEDPT